jgi:diguanylate cyclase
VRYALISAVPVFILGLVLAVSLRGEANRRGLSEGRSAAALVARTAVQPLLDGRPLSQGVAGREYAALRRLTSDAVKEHDVLRLRLRDLSGQVVFSDDGSGFSGKPDPDALRAARGQVVAEIDRLNVDDRHAGSVGPTAVEVYLPLEAGTPKRRVGVLEIYLPYKPISRDIASGLHRLYLDLGVGLGLVYLALFLITASVSRGLRRELNLNAYLAEHDNLTGLPNRRQFSRYAAQTLDAKSSHQRSMVVAIVDLDHFKDVNDTLGHHRGDQLLVQIASRLAENMQDNDMVARLGGDEFGLILRDVSDAQQALCHLRTVIEREVEINDLPLSIQASIGYAVSPQDGHDADTLLQQADMAMYVAKVDHAGVSQYQPSMNHYDTAKLSLAGELRHAIDQDQLVLHYQPQTTLASGRIEVVEALVRWQHPTRGLLYPDAFLPIAEQTDIIELLTDWVLRTALTEITNLGDHLAEQLTVAVNLSARSLSRADLPHQITTTLTDLRLPARRLRVEVTETALLTDPSRAARLLNQLAAAGVYSSLDDFGQGQTSLAYLAELPVRELKIDKSFVVDMLKNPAHAAIVKSIIDLAHNLNLRVVAEGMETPQIHRALSGLGCDIAQGFGIAKPMPIDMLHLWLDPMRSNGPRDQGHPQLVPRSTT